MTTLTANAVIQAVDRFSGPIGRMAGALGALHSRAAGVVDRTAAATRKLQAAATPTAIGLGLMIHKTQEFEKKALGARIATIADALERVGGVATINHKRIAQEGDAIRASALAISKLYGVSPTGLMEAAEAAAKMGIELKKAEAVMKASAIWKMADPDIGYGKGAEFLGTLGLQFRAPTEIDKYNAWIKAVADKIALTASATRTSISRIQEGFRQFSGTFATFGGTIDQASALLGGMTQGGLLDVESGTALKSSALRFIRPTIEGTAALAALGIDRRNYMDLTGADPRRAANQLMQLFPGYISKTAKWGLYRQLAAAQKSGLGADPEFINRIAAQIQKLTKGRETIEDVHGKVLTAITTSGGKVDFFKYLGDIAKLVETGKISDAQMGVIFEGRHLARMKTLFRQWPEVMRILKIITGAKGEGLDATRDLYKDSAFGRWEMAMASLERAMIRLRSSEGITGLINQFERLAGAIADLPPGAVQTVGYLVAALGGLATAGVIASGVGLLATSLAVIGSKIILVGALLFGLGYAAYWVYENWDEVKAKLGEVWDAIKQKAADIGAAIKRALPGPLRAAVEAIQWVIENWSTLVARVETGVERIKAALSSMATNLKAGNPAPILKHAPGPLGMLFKAWDWWNKSSAPATGGPSVPSTGAPLIRDLNPAAGPRTIDVTGKVQAEGSVTGKVQVDITVRDSAGRPVERKSTTGDLRGPLKTGKTMPDVTGPAAGGPR